MRTLPSARSFFSSSGNSSVFRREIHSGEIGSVATSRRCLPREREYEMRKKQEEEEEEEMTTMMKQMPRTLSHVIDVHHRARRKLNIARRHINIYIYMYVYMYTHACARAVLMQRLFFSLLSFSL